MDLRAVYEDVITQIHEEYLPYLCKKVGLQFKPYPDNTALRWNKILEWFEIANDFKQMFEETYQQSYGDMPIEKLMSLPVEPLCEMAKVAQERQGRIFLLLKSRHEANLGRTS